MGLILWGGCKRRTDFRYFITGFSLFLPGIFLPLDHQAKYMGSPGSLFAHHGDTTFRQAKAKSSG